MENEEHCDFKKLRSILIRTHMLDLIHTTEEMHYEAYRAQQMETRKFGEARPRKLDNPKFKEEEDNLRKRFTEQVKIEEHRFRQWEQKLISERDRLNKDLESTHAAYVECRVVSTRLTVTQHQAARGRARADAGQHGAQRASLGWGVAVEVGSRSWSRTEGMEGTEGMEEKEDSDRRASQRASEHQDECGSPCVYGRSVSLLHSARLCVASLSLSRASSASCSQVISRHGMVCGELVTCADDGLG